MAAREFGQLVEQRMAELGLSQNRLASRLGELSDGRIFDATQIRMIREGRRRLDQELVGKLIEILDLDPAQAWWTAEIWPRDLELATYRTLRERRRRTDRQLDRQVADGEAASSLGGSSTTSRSTSNRLAFRLRRRAA